MGIFMWIVFLHTAQWVLESREESREPRHLGHPPPPGLTQQARLPSWGAQASELFPLPTLIHSLPREPKLLNSQCPPPACQTPLPSQSREPRCPALQSLLLSPPPNSHYTPKVQREPRHPGLNPLTPTHLPPLPSQRTQASICTPSSLFAPAPQQRENRDAGVWCPF